MVPADWGMEQGAWGMEHGAWGMGHGAKTPTARSCQGL